ncbi:MAG: hypothetical protein JNK10_14640, partial [Cyclobacteriaceae bacterium]|nr:hypothetical protein [Cyclobacteriaceae bacterium]
LPSISGSVQLVKESSGDYSISDASFGLYGCVYFFPPATGVSLTVDCGVIFLGGSDQGSKSYTLTSVTTNGTELTIEWINSAGDAARTTLTRTGGWPMNLHL